MENSDTFHTNAIDNESDLFIKEVGSSLPPTESNTLVNGTGLPFDQTENLKSSSDFDFSKTYKPIPGLTRKQTFEVMSKKLIQKNKTCVLVKQSERTKTISCRSTSCDYLGSLYFSGKCESLSLNNLCCGDFADKNIRGIVSTCSKKKNKLATSIAGKQCYGDLLIYCPDQSYTKEDFIYCLDAMRKNFFEELNKV